LLYICPNPKNVDNRNEFKLWTLSDISIFFRFITWKIQGFDSEGVYGYIRARWFLLTFAVKNVKLSIKWSLPKNIISVCDVEY
jgi:hypothetical protein